MSEIANDPGVIRAVALLVPIAAVSLLASRRPPAAVATGALLATLWNVPMLLAVNLIAGAAGWWTFEVAGGAVRTVPIDLLLGWAVLWGAIPVLAFRRAPMVVVLAVFLLLDVALMPLASPVVVLGDRWLVGEAAALAVAFVPGLLLSRWTAEQRRLPGRAALQVALSGLLVLWLLPLAALDATAGLFTLLGEVAMPQRFALGAGLALVALLGVAGVQDFVERGDGTPVPFDPPRRLVRSGPYAYVANPMQASVCGMLLLSTLLTGSWRLAIAAVVAAAYGGGLAAWHEAEELRDRFGADWAIYHAGVRAWWPSWRPSPVIANGTLWVAASCEQCTGVARFFDQRAATGLAVRAAEDHPDALRRLTYESGGNRWHGVAAIARALEHVSLGWAVAGWVLRLPGVVSVLQLLTDVAGAGPRELAAHRT